MLNMTYKQKIAQAKKLREEFKNVYSYYTNSLTKELNDNLKSDSVLEFPNSDILFIINCYNCAFMEFDPTISLYYQARLISSKEMLEDLINDITLYRKIEKFSNNAFLTYSVPVYVFHIDKKFHFDKSIKLFDIADCLKEKL